MNRRRVGQPARKLVVPVEPAPGKLAVAVPEAAWLLNVGVSTMWALIHSGELSSFTVGRRRLVAVGVIEAFIAAGGTSDGLR
jgi:excisionase family DNA binding protein